MEQKFDYGKYLENIDKYFENKKFLDTGTVFTNSKCIFIDFYDIVKSPAIPILLTLKELSATKEIRGFDISPLGNLSVAGVIEWYVNRKNKNFMVDLYSGGFTDENRETRMTTINQLYDLFLNQEIFYTNNFFDLNFVNVLLHLRETKTLVEKIIFYTPYKNECVASVCDVIMGHKSFSYIYGDFKEIVKDKVPKDTTYVLADIEYVKMLKDIDRLELASVVLPYEYAYNYNSNGELKYPIEEWQSSIPFKFNLYPAMAEVVAD